VAVTYFGVDAFSAVPFGGNPAVVCLWDTGPEAGSGIAPDTGWMQRVGAEFNQPATAFLWEDEHGRQLRWFTARAELPLCGHGTLATAHVLYETGRASVDDVLTFHARSDSLTVRHVGGLIWMDLPGATLTETAAPDRVLAALGLDTAEWVGQNEFEYVVRVVDAAAVEKLTPSSAAILALPVQRVGVTAPGGDDVDFTSRVFLPAMGIDEDQVTGSAHAVLGQLWAGWLGRTELTARQASVRGGELALVVGEETVQVGGTALITTEGELLV
jgi:predicted PhzF superfamily epimerase YddE/YHI9